MFDFHGELAEEKHPTSLSRREMLLRQYGRHGLGVGEEGKFATSHEVVMGFEQVEDGE
jgi:hypothetical protein